MYVTSLVLLLLGVLAVVVLRYAGVGGQPQGEGTLSPGSPPPPPPSGGGGGNLTGPGGVLVLFPSLPPWVPFVLLASVLLLFVVVALPRARRYLRDREEEARDRRRAAPTVPAGVRDALNRASTELDLGADPRTVILGLYEEMLAHLRPLVDSYEADTPEEIREVHLNRLGVRPAAARTLTRLFEEARYSTHPMGPQQSAAAQEAVRTTLEDLDRQAHRA
jgi:Domain of unknown function (DUF4129)